MESRDSFDCTPHQYHAGLDTLWAALPELKGPQEIDVYTLTAEEITRLRAENELLREALQREINQDWRECSLAEHERANRLQAENELLRTFIQIDYDQYEEHHPYARELLRTYPWLADAAVAAEEEQ